ncbi:MAG: DUF4443 domain-containing protein [Candidatus Altiarchaeales archaeon]|nr:DUF4443 domain-containing protein [Candidatus Altiarchaeales archaeon]MBD3415504.1 DUF4443 domain-containing protein [Candidatus Altiarchaeales archaeon]
MVGAEPSFSDVHLTRTLFLLDSGPVGRKRLVKILGVGEGSVRTIIKRLSSEGLVGSTKQGHRLTEKGEVEVERLLERISKPVSVEVSDLVDSPHKSLVVVSSAIEGVGSGVGLRDVALRAGADGAVILVYDGALRFPDSYLDLSDYPNSIFELDRLNFTIGDVAVIGFGGSQSSAVDGALAVALKLLV